MWSALVLLTMAVFSVISGWWLWKSSDSVDPDSRIYKVHKANYYAFSWLFGPDRRFEEISEKHLKHWAKRMIMLGVSSMVLDIVVGIWILSQ